MNNYGGEMKKYTVIGLEVLVSAIFIIAIVILALNINKNKNYKIPRKIMSCRIIRRQLMKHIGNY